jgi:predicted dehydrogenase
MAKILDHVRWGLIGAGDVAEHKGGPALYNVPHSSLAAVMSRRRERAEDFARRHGAQRVYTSLQDLLADEKVDAVYIATPPNTHAELTVRAAESGKHVLCEKPMAMDAAECARMTEACRAGGVQLMIAYYRRFWPVVEKMKELVQAGAIGRVLRGRAAVADLYRPREDGERAWLVQPDTAGGGFLTDVASHRLDLFCHFLGKPLEVSALVDTQHFEFGVDDASTLLIRFDGGAHASGSFSWNVGAPADEFELWGTEGRLVSRNLGRGDLDLYSRTRHESYRLPAPAITHLGLVEHFVDRLRSGSPNDLPGESGLLATCITDAAYRSAREGAAVHIAETIGV